MKWKKHRNFPFLQLFNFSSLWCSFSEIRLTEFFVITKLIENWIKNDFVEYHKNVLQTNYYFQSIFYFSTFVDIIALEIFDSLFYSIGIYIYFILFENTIKKCQKCQIKPKNHLHQYNSQQVTFRNEKFWSTFMYLRYAFSCCNPLRIIFVLLSFIAENHLRENFFVNIFVSFVFKHKF